MAKSQVTIAVQIESDEVAELILDFARLNPGKYGLKPTLESYFTLEAADAAKRVVADAQLVELIALETSMKATHNAAREAAVTILTPGVKETLDEVVKVDAVEVAEELVDIKEE